MSGLKKIRSALASGFRKIVERPLYSAGISAYRMGVKLAGMRNRKAALLWQGQKEIFSKLEKTRKEGERWIWLHAASLGEFEQGRPILEQLRKDHPEYKILLTFFSPSGYEVRKNYAGADCVCYLPFDTPGRVRRFLDVVRPEMAIFVKYEFWRNYLETLHKRGIPTYLVSAVFRPDQFFFKRRSAWYGHWLRWYTGIFVQDERSRELLAGIGVNNVKVCGDTRFDRVADIRASRKPLPLFEKFAEGRPVMMAGSSWEKDEDVYGSWFDSHPEVKLIIAPHEYDDVRLGVLKKRFANGALLLSELEKGAECAGKQVLVVDCFGLLSSAYAYCDVAYVGGAFGSGLHNINEAAVYDVPVIYGPNNSKFIEAREMAEAGGGFPIASKEDFEILAARFFEGGNAAKEREEAGEKAGKYIRSKLGATQKILESL